MYQPEVEELIEELINKIKVLETVQSNPRDEEGAKIGETSTDTAVISEESRDNQVIEAPTYGPSINPLNVTWQISTPVILYSESRPGVNIRSAGILLNRGYYKLDFTFVNVLSGFGVGLFEPETKKFQKLLGHHSTFYKQEPTNTKAEQYHLYANRGFNDIYITIEKSGLIGLTDGNGVYLPENFRGMIFVTVYKFKKLN